MASASTAPAATAAPAPRFGGGGVKCKQCAGTVYASERIDYDGNTWHTTCFKCLQCKSEIPLARVAMISGDLYCKNCFMRIFKEKGQYSSFGEKTLPKAGEGGARDRAATHEPVSSSSSSASASANGSSGGGSSLAAVSERRSSVLLTCQVSDCRAARQGSSNFCAEHVGSPAAAESEQLAALFDAVSSKNVDKVSSLLRELKSADILFRPNAKGQTLFEAAFAGIANSRNAGETIVQWLRKHNAELEKKQ